jgi:hypothetical protein
MQERDRLKQLLQTTACIVDASSWGLNVQDDLGSRWVRLDGGLLEDDYQFFADCCTCPDDRNALAAGILENLLVKQGHSSGWAEWAVNRKNDSLQPAADQLEQHEVAPGMYFVFGKKEDAIAQWVDAVGFSAAVRELAEIIRVGKANQQASRPAAATSTRQEKPDWDRTAGLLFYGGRTIPISMKATNIIPVLDALQASGWDLAVQSPFFFIAVNGSRCFREEQLQEARKQLNRKCRVHKCRLRFAIRNRDWIRWFPAP